MADSLDFELLYVREPCIDLHPIDKNSIALEDGATTLVLSE